MRIGILGGGQLGRMLALAGTPLDLRFRVLEPASVAATDAVAERIVGEYEDYAALADFVRGLDLVTYEFENVPVATTRWLALRVPVYPPPDALEVAQDRLHEKSFFQRTGIPIPSFRAVDTRTDFDAALAAVGLPAVLKTRRFGYDGKGQSVICTPAEAETAWQLLGGRPLILEQFVPFDRELSILAVRGRDGTTAFYPLVENTHSQGILRRSLAPAGPVAGVSDPGFKVSDPGFKVSDPGHSDLQAQAARHAAAALDALNYVGVLAIEFFAVGGRLLANEMAPRVHNSGHWTIEGAETSQFENHLRAVVGWPLGSTRACGWSGMWNLIGMLPDAAAVLAVPGAHLHLYGKSPRPGRKLGHVTLWAEDAATFTERRRELEAILPLLTD